MARICSGVVPQQPPTTLTRPSAGELPELRRHELRALVVAAELVRQPGVRVGAGEGVGDAGDLGQVRAHLLGAERAVEADGEGAGVADRVPEGGGGLAGEGAPRAVGDRARDHQRQAHALLGEDLLGGEDRGLGVQGVEDRLDEEEVGAAVDEAADLLGVGGAEVVEADGAEAGVVDVGRHRGGAVGGAEGAGDEAAAAVLGLGAVGGAADEARALAVELVDHRAHAVVGLGDGGGGEGVGLEDVRTGHGVGEVDRLDRLGLGEDEEVVVALLVMVADPEAVAAEVVLVEAEALDLGAHGAVEHEDPLAGGGGQGLERRGAMGCVTVCATVGLTSEAMARSIHWSRGRDAGLYRPEGPGMERPGDG